MSFINDVFSGIEKALMGAAADTLTSLAGKMTNGGVLPGDIDIMSITLQSEDGQRKYDLMSQVKGFEIYESILSPVIFAEFVIADSMGMLEKFPIIGEEYINVMYLTPKNQNIKGFTLRVNQVKNKVVTENNKMITYTLQCVSSDLMNNSKRLVTKKYEDTISNVVEGVLRDDLGTILGYTVDTTIGIEKGLITRMEPYKAIDFLRRRAVSVEYPSSSFVFFQNGRGYFFTTIEKLMDQGAKKIASGMSNKKFFFDTARKESVKDVTMRNILAYNQLIFTDTISKVSSGGVTNVVQAIDLVTGGVKKVTYTDNVGADKFKSAEGKGAALNSSNFTRQHGKTTAKTRVIPTSADKPSTQLAEKLSTTSAYASKIAQNIVQVHIYGDSDLAIGDVIECAFPSATSNSKDSPQARLDSGNYLIAKIKHIVINSDRPQHTMALELIKGGFKETA